MSKLKEKSTLLNALELANTEGILNTTAISVYGQQINKIGQVIFNYNGSNQNEAYQHYIQELKDSIDNLNKHIDTLSAFVNLSDSKE